MVKKGEKNSKNLYKVIGDMFKDGAHGEANNRGEAKNREESLVKTPQRERKSWMEEIEIYGQYNRYIYIYILISRQYNRYINESKFNQEVHKLLEFN